MLLKSVGKSYCDGPSNQLNWGLFYAMSQVLVYKIYFRGESHNFLGLRSQQNRGKQRISWDLGCHVSKGKVPSPIYCVTSHRVTLLYPLMRRQHATFVLALFMFGKQSPYKFICWMLNWCCSLESFRLEYKHCKKNIIIFKNAWTFGPIAFVFVFKWYTLWMLARVSPSTLNLLKCHTRVVKKYHTHMVKNDFVIIICWL